MSFISELKRRGLIQVGVTYLLVAWGVAQVADLLLENFQIDDGVMQLILVLLGIGFVVSIVLAWVFDLRWDGIYLERKLVNAAESPSALTAEVKNESIAVLPFVNMSSDPEQEYFSDGLSEELLNLLAKIPELRVAARTSAFSFKGKDTKIHDIGRELGVAHVLEGSVRKAENQIRITAQLIEARTGMHLWSETYDRSLSNVFVIQDEIASQVVGQLKITLLGDLPMAEETDPEAYALFLQANQLRNQHTPESLAKAVELYRKAIAIDADYPAAWERLATVYSEQANENLRPSEDGYQLCRDANNQALRINPGYAPAYAGLGWVAVYYDNDLAVAAAHFERALALEPENFKVLGDSLVLLEALGHLDKLVAISEYLVTRDPANPIAHYNLGNNYKLTGRLDEAVASYNKAIMLAPDMIGGQYHVGMALLLKGDAQSALDAFQRESDEEFRVKGTAMAFYTLERHTEYEEAFTELRERWGEVWAPEIAQVYAWVGDADAAFKWLEKEFDMSGTSDWADITSDVLLASIHDDPRWLPFLEKIGKSPAQLSAIQFVVNVPQ